MRIAATRWLLLFACIGFLPTTLPAQTPSNNHILHAVGDHFELDGKRIQIISGSIHYARIPRAYWRDRLKKARAMGLNTIETYVFWNLHEPAPGYFDFRGQLDVAEFIREAQQEGLYVILRPGPYVCAEWEYGGYPAWLLSNPNLKPRTTDPAFLFAASKWLHRLGKELAPLQSGNGGPIIATQVENEYGSFGNDHNYMERIKEILIDSGFNKSMLYTADGADNLAQGSLSELPAAINFGTGDAKTEFAKLQKFRANGPRFNSEYWDGWFDHWGERHHTGNANIEANDLAWMLSQGDSVNLYMFEGGTSFGWMNGANIDGHGTYQPTVTSYDYDAPLTESGQLTPKFSLFRSVIQKATGITPPAPPAPTPTTALAPVTLTQSVSLFSILPQPLANKTILPMESYHQSYGYILYRTILPKPTTGTLNITAHSYAQIYLDGNFNQPIATLDRRLKQDSLKITTTHPNTQLDILVEDTGRVNFGHHFPLDHAGIIGQPTLNGAALTHWRIYTLPIEHPSTLPFRNGPCTGACLYQATFDITKPTDTFLDTRTLGKGIVFLNGQPLGRFWNIGPQGTLYVPAPWLKPGRNQLVILDLKGKSTPTIHFLDHSILDWKP